MGKGKRQHLNTLYSPPLNSSDLLTSTKHLEPPPLYNNKSVEPDDDAPLFTLITTYFSYLVLIVFGHALDFFGRIFYPAAFAHLGVTNGLAPINSGFDTFYHRRLYMRIRDCFNRPITGVPGRTIKLLDRVSTDYNHTFEMTNTQTEALNLSSYNYLGFAQSNGPCADHVEQGVKKYGLSLCSPRLECGTSELHIETEALVARFVGHEASIVFSMGFATNSSTIPALIGKGGLIISDSLNHSSLVFGARLTGSTVKVFRHNGMRCLTQMLIILNKFCANQLHTASLALTGHGKRFWLLLKVFIVWKGRSAACQRLCS